MPSTARRRLSVVMSAGVVGLMAAGCGGGAGSGAAPHAVDQEARDGIKRLNDYLGTVPDNGESEKTLLATLNQNNQYLRNAIRDMKCDIWKLQPGHTGSCPGGGSTPPTNMPKYPQ